MIQDIFPHQLYNQFQPQMKAEDEDIVLNVVDGRILVHTQALEQDELQFPSVRTVITSLRRIAEGQNMETAPNDAEEISTDATLIYGFAIDAKKYFLLRTEFAESDIPEGYSYVEERSLRREGLGPQEELFASITGKHLTDWYRDNRFCGRCGHPMVHSKTERAMTCEACHYTSYPRIMPAVIVGVTNGERLLITRYRTGYAHNALIAGFTEIGETVEETVAREVMEEAGIRVKNITYYKSQPWGSANDILLGYYCEVDGDDTITMDSGELKYAEWVRREDIVLQPGHFSLTNEMMEKFKTKQ